MLIFRFYLIILNIFIRKTVCDTLAVNNGKPPARRGTKPLARSHAKTVAGLAPVLALEKVPYLLQ